MHNDSLLLDYAQHKIRVTAERRAHILEHPEMNDQFDKIVETLTMPDLIIATTADPSVHVYHRLYPHTPVTRKYLQVAVKLLADDAFMLTAYFSRRLKKGSIVWQA